MIQVSVIIPVFKDEGGIIKTLQALEKQSLPRQNWELIVVDNSPTPSESLQQIVVAAQGSYLHEGSPGSYAARNAGIRSSLGSILAFTDSACIPSTNWILNGMQALHSQGRECVVGGKITMRPEKDTRLLEVYDSVYRLPQSEFIRHHATAATANLFAFRSTFERVGFFDATLYSGGDFEWCERLKPLGIPVLYSELTEVEHPCETSWAKTFQRVRRLASTKPMAATNRKKGLGLKSKMELSWTTSLQVMSLRVFFLLVKRAERLRVFLGAARERA